MKTRRECEKTFDAGSVEGLWPERLQSLKNLRICEGDIDSALAVIEIEPVIRVLTICS